MFQNEGNFSEEYTKGYEPNPIITADTETPGDKGETESIGPKYGLSKPQRKRIKGTIIHDQGGRAAE